MSDPSTGDTDEFPVIPTLIESKQQPLSQSEEIVFWQGFEEGNDRKSIQGWRHNRYKDPRLNQAYELGFQAGHKERLGRSWQFPTTL